MQYASFSLCFCWCLVEEGKLSMGVFRQKMTCSQNSQLKNSRDPSGRTQIKSHFSFYAQSLSHTITHTHTHTHTHTVCLSRVCVSERFPHVWPGVCALSVGLVSGANRQYLSLLCSCYRRFIRPVEPLTLLKTQFN